MLRNIIIYIFQSIAVIIPAALIFYYALNAGGLPDNDYWGEMEQILTSPESNFSRKLSDWFQRGNEHYTLLPKLVYAANLMITGGNNVGLSLFSWFMGLLQVPLLYQLIPVKNKQNPVLFILLLFVVSAFIFSPRQAHNWILGMSGTAWITANLFSIAALVALHTYADKKGHVYFFLVFVSGLCAVATYSTSLALFPSLIIAAFLYRLSRRDQLLITAYCISILGLYFLTYSTPEHHPAIQQSLPVLVTYIFSFLGALFTLQLNLALMAGIFGVVSSLFMVVFIYRNKTYWYSAIPWISIQLYACANASMAALARSGFGLDQVFSSRYGSLPALFWLSWIMLAITLCIQVQASFRKTAWVIVICISSIIIVSTYRLGLQVAAPLLESARLKSLSLASIYSHAIDIELTDATGLSQFNYEELQLIIKILAATRHIPFNGLFQQCPEIGSPIAKTGAGASAVLGNFDEIQLRNDQVIMVRGWAYENGSDPDCVVITNQENMVRGVAIYGMERADVAQATQNQAGLNSGWQGYGKIHKHDKIIKVYMLTKKGYWLLINGSFQVHRQPLAFKKIEP